MPSNAWLGGSRILQFLSIIYIGSWLRLFFVAAQGLFCSSVTFSALNHFVSKEFQPLSSATVRTSLIISENLRPLRGKFAVVYENSALVNRTQKSFLAGKLIHAIVPASVLYVLIDELGRKVFRGSSLFGYWDEAFLLLCFLVILIERWTDRENRLSTSPIDSGMAIFIAIAFAHMINVGFFRDVAFEGFRVVAQYMLFYFVISRWVTTDDRAKTLLTGLLMVVGTLSVHGLLQYVFQVQTPASWTDAAEKTVGTRVFSIVESPNILGSMMVLFLPMAFALFMNKERKPLWRLVLLGITGSMGLCVLLTQSRGAWLGLLIALVIFCLLVRPVWLLLLTGGAFASLLVPTVYARISYMLTPQFVASSQRGGRMLRYQTGLQMFFDRPFTGLGLGHFGGAVAMNHKDLFPTTFYMDNYWLKTLVEMGLPGLIGYMFLMGLLLVWGLRAVKAAEKKGNKMLAAGAMAGLTGVVLHNFLENIFEVPYMVVYFWTVAALLMYWGFGIAKAASLKKDV